MQKWDSPQIWDAILAYEQAKSEYEDAKHRLAQANQSLLALWGITDYMDQFTVDGRVAMWQEIKLQQRTAQQTLDIGE